MRACVSASCLGADFSRLKEDLQSVSCIDGVSFHHMDVMDGHFVDNLSFGFGVVKTVRSFSDIPLDVHLMIQTPSSFIFRFAQLSDMLSFHIEAYPEYKDILKELRSKFPSLKLGLAVNPETPIDRIFDDVSSLDFVNVMSVHPGYGGQAFIEESVSKVQVLHDFLVSKSLDSKVLIEVDGGVTGSNAESLVQAGALILVSGSYIYKKEGLNQRKKAVESLCISVK